MRRNHFQGFTLVELLVVISIIATLVGLLLPAVQAAREAALRAQCSNNLKQIGIALHAYHTQQQVFPINYAGDTAQVSSLNTTGRSWLLAILPHMEQNNLYQTVDTKQPLSFSDASKGIDNLRAAETKVDVFLCPSDRNGPTARLKDRAGPSVSTAGWKGWAITNYKAVGGSNWGANSASSTDFVSSWPKGRFPNSEDGINQGNGFICPGGNGPVPTSIRDIRDGTTNTIVVGEAVPSFCDHTWWYWWNGATATCAIPLNYPGSDGDPRTLRTDKADWPNNYSFMSRHPGGGNFCIGDGAVRFLSDSIDLQLYRDLATIKGQEVSSIPQ